VYQPRAWKTLLPIKASRVKKVCRLRSFSKARTVAERIFAEEPEAPGKLRRSLRLLQKYLKQGKKWYESHKSSKYKVTNRSWFRRRTSLGNNDRSVSIQWQKVVERLQDLPSQSHSGSSVQHPSAVSTMFVLRPFDSMKAWIYLVHTSQAIFVFVSLFAKFI